MTGTTTGDYVDPLGRGGFSRQQKKRPGALAAAVAVHLGVAGVVMLMPGVTVIPEKFKPIWIDNIAKPKPPEPKQAVEPAPRKPLQSERYQDKIVALDPVIPIGGTGEAVETAGGGGTLTGGGDIMISNPPTDPPLPLLTAARIDPRFADRFQPAYPPALLRLEMEGSATVRISIDEQGRVIAVALVATDDPAFFEATRRHALRNWRFLPAMRDGQPVASSREMTVHFRITEE
jgi:periplasmic protein TonB